LNPNPTVIHLRALTPAMHFACWFRLFVVLGSCAFSVYFVYAAWLIYRQLSSIGEGLSPKAYYLIIGGLLLLAFSLWRLLHALRRLKGFQTQYRAHIEAAREA
jgi:type VI protein secretion system component VasK